jgi:hypothetical protein
VTASGPGGSSKYGSSDNRAPSRAAVIRQALQRERRREVATRDAAILAAAAADDELDALAEHAARTPLDDLA